MTWATMSVEAIEKEANKAWKSFGHKTALKVLTGYNFHDDAYFVRIIEMRYPASSFMNTSVMDTAANPKSLRIARNGSVPYIKKMVMFLSRAVSGVKEGIKTG